MNGVLWMMGRCLPTEQVKGSIAICLFLLQLGRRCGRGVSAPKRNGGGEWQPHEWQPHERRVQSWSNSITAYMCSNHIWRTNTFNLLLDFFFLNCVDWINSVAKPGHCALLNVRRFQTPLTSITTLLVVWLLQHGANASAARNMWDSEGWGRQLRQSPQGEASYRWLGV